jgi:DNA-binding beta-propeller fold protein YncE
MWKILLAVVAIIALGILAALQLQEEPAPEFSALGSVAIDGTAGILRAGPNGQFLALTNRARNSIDIIDLAVPGLPEPLARLELPATPVGLGLSPDGKWALATLEDRRPKEGEAPFDMQRPGMLAFIDLTEQAAPRLIRTIGIDGHPGSMELTTAGDELVAVVAIPNAPLYVSDGLVAQAGTPDAVDISAAGKVQVVAVNPETPGTWRVSTLDISKDLLRNTLMLTPTDPQPDYVALSPGRHMAAVALRENNGILLIDLNGPEISGAFHLGPRTDRLTETRVAGGSTTAEEPDSATAETTDSTTAGNSSKGMAAGDEADAPDNDAAEETPAADTEVAPVIATGLAQEAARPHYPRVIVFTPDGQHLLSADAAQPDSATDTGLSVWSLTGDLVWEGGGRQASDAAQPSSAPRQTAAWDFSGVATARFGSRNFAFAASATDSALLVFDIENVSAPALVQALPTGTKPGSVATIPNGNLVVVAATGENSDTLSVFRYTPAEASGSPLDRIR